MDFISGEILSVHPEWRLIKVNVLKQRKTNLTVYSQTEYIQADISTKYKKYLGEYMVGRYIYVYVKYRDDFGKLIANYQSSNFKDSTKNKFNTDGKNNSDKLFGK